MKIRTPRIPLMGSSNMSSNPHPKKQDIMQMSHMKSKSLFNTKKISKVSQSLLHNNPQEGKSVDPFKGTDLQHQTRRFDSCNMSVKKHFDWKLEPLVHNWDFGGHLNENVKEIKAEFEGKDVNMHKLHQLKHTFIKNNHKRRNMKEYFQKYSNSERIGVPELQRIVKQYGFDVNQEEAQLMFRLTNHRTDKPNHNHLDIKGFINLMTKENIFFKTLTVSKVKEEKKQNNQNIYLSFPDNVHQVLKNGFSKLKEAFNIYKAREEPINYQRFDHVFKKIGITFMALTNQQKKTIFHKFQTQDNNFNVEGLLGAIASQEHFKRDLVARKSPFESNIRFKEEIEAQKANKEDKFDFKKMDNYQYEQQIMKARSVLNQIKNVNNKVTQDSILKQLCSSQKVAKKQLRKKVQQFLQTHGINFNKQFYDCFIDYLDYSVEGTINQKGLVNQIFEESQNHAYQRFQRRLRSPPPTLSLNKSQSLQYFHQKTAKQTLNKLKYNIFDAEVSKVYKQFDKDSDGYISREELKTGISRKLNSIDEWQIQNLVNYFDHNQKGYLQYKEFAEKYEPQPKKEPQVDKAAYLRSMSEVFQSKSKYVRQSKTYSNIIVIPDYQNPTKYSAWPAHLQRHDLSMLQPSKKAPYFANQYDRFKSSQKHTLGLSSKLEKSRVLQNKVQKLKNWNDFHQQRISNKTVLQVKKQKAKQYRNKLAQQTFKSRIYQTDE